MDRYCLPDNYVIRLDPIFHDDRKLKDEYQNSVYRYARMVLDLRAHACVQDIGTGSGFKLLKYFSHAETIGIDLPQTVKWLRKEYPRRSWAEAPDPECDLLICSDVIEHVLCPDDLLNQLFNIRFKDLIISTPARELLPNKDGPPDNPAHVREWASEEFRRYIKDRMASFRFPVPDFSIQYFGIANQEQATQLIHVRGPN